MSSKSQMIFISLIITFSLVNYNCSGDKQKNARILEHKSQENSITLTVSGISCHSCINAIKRTLLGLDGIVDVRINLDKEKNNVMVSFNPDVINVEKIKAAINGTGKHVVDSDQDED